MTGENFGAFFVRKCVAQKTYFVLKFAPQTCHLKNRGLAKGKDYATLAWRAEFGYDGTPTVVQIVPCAVIHLSHTDLGRRDPSPNLIRNARTSWETDFLPLLVLTRRGRSTGKNEYW